MTMMSGIQCFITLILLSEFSELPRRFGFSKIPRKFYFVFTCARRKQVKLYMVQQKEEEEEAFSFMVVGMASQGNHETGGCKITQIERCQPCCNKYHMNTSNFNFSSKY